MHKPKLELLVGAWHLLFQVMGFGNPTAGGFKTMKDALLAVHELNGWLFEKFGIVLAVSGHWWHELLMPQSEPEIGYSAKWNNPRAIDLAEWFKLIRQGKAPRIGRIIPGGFGLPGSDNGAFINPDLKRRKLMHDMVVFSLGKSDYVKKENLGHGNIITWTGPDGLRWQRLTQGRDICLSHTRNPQLEEWKLIVNGIGEAIREARMHGYIFSNVLMEGKPAGDPSYLDVFTDTSLEILGINQINQIVGSRVAEWQGEFCHSRGAGEKFASALRQAIRAGVFRGRIHLNSGGIASKKFVKMLTVKGGTLASKFQQYVDNDYLPGEGPKEWVDDQVDTIGVGTKWSAKTGQPFQIEFDARFSRYPDTIDALKKSAMWTIETFNEAVAKNL